MAGDEWSFLDGILFRGCFRGVYKSCHKPLGAIQKKFKKQNIKIEKFYKSRERKCQFRSDKGKFELYKGLGNWFPATYEPGKVSDFFQKNFMFIFNFLIRLKFFQQFLQCSELMRSLKKDIKNLSLLI